LFRNKFASLQDFNPACEKVVTSAGLVFAFTMLAMLTSDLRTIGQVGSTVCIGLLLDTLIVRSFVVPCVLRIIGPWFWLANTGALSSATAAIRP
jgi:uncharacterized membrane protein YdfJ with MMPL/SSD domain